MILISANSVIIPNITLEHINISYLLEIPFIIVLTKIDMVPDNIYNETKLNIEKFLFGIIKSSIF